MLSFLLSNSDFFISIILIKVGLFTSGNSFLTLFLSFSLCFNIWSSITGGIINSEILLHIWEYWPFCDNLIDTVDSGDSHMNHVKGTYPFFPLGIIIVLSAIFWLLINNEIVSYLVSLKNESEGQKITVLIIPLDSTFIPKLTGYFLP